MRIGVFEFESGKFPWRLAVAGAALGVILGIAGYAWFSAEGQALMAELNKKLVYTGEGNEAALLETQLGSRAHGAVVALCARFPWLSGLFAYRDSHTPQMLLYMFRAYAASKTQLIRAAWMYETDTAVKEGIDPPTKYQQVLETVLTSNKIPDPKYKPKPPSTTDVLMNYVMPIGAFLMMALMMVR